MKWKSQCLVWIIVPNASPTYQVVTNESGKNSKTLPTLTGTKYTAQYSMARMAASGRTQRGYSYSYLQNSRSISFPDARTHENYYHPRSRTEQNLQFEPHDHRRQRIQNRKSELRRTENGDRIQLSKRGGHRKNYFTKLFLELFAALGAIEPELSSQVVFPGPTSKSRFEPEISVECKMRGYCETIPNYPKDQVKQLTEKLGDELRGKLQMDELDTDDIQIAQRFGSEGLTFGLCNASEKILTPDSLQDKNNKWWTVFQDRDNNMTQGFRSEICNDRDGSCSRLVNFPPGYTNKCDQKYVYRSVVIVEGNKAVGMRNLKLPSCCSCMITAPSF